MIDVAIIGGGPAALGAALYVARSGKSCTVFEKQFVGGQASTTYEIDNYLGFPDAPSGSVLSEMMLNHVLKFDVKFRYNEVKALDLSGDIKKIFTAKKEFEAKSVILAMGAAPARLDVPGEAEFSGKGVSYCATCDGMFFKDKTACVVGGGNTAIEDALYLSPIAKKVYLIHRRDEFRASPLLVDRLKECENVDFLLKSRITEIKGAEKLEKLIIEGSEGAFTLSTDALFVAVGTKPSADLVKDIISCDEKGFIITDEDMKTSIPGVFAAGDIRHKNLRQVITAVSDGAIAGEEAAKYVNSLR
ncbi:MAG: thioredoxin-disulfide reductase [Clostridia bacterium]|nr:thioredoxin-disulfide reductase [Clostridia bacterium]